MEHKLGCENVVGYFRYDLGQVSNWALDPKRRIVAIISKPHYSLRMASKAR